MSITRELGQRIRFYRKKMKLSQEQFAEMCDLHPTYIGQIERGEKNATIESIYKISSALNVSLEDLFNNIEVLAASDNDSLSKINRSLSQLPTETQEKICNILQEILQLL